MKRGTFYFLLIILTLLITSCYKESEHEANKFTFDSLIMNLDIEKNQLLADGVDETRIKIQFDIKSNTDTLNFKAILSEGIFKSNKNDTIILKPVLETNDSGEIEKFIAFKVVAPLRVGDSEIQLNLNNYTKTINLIYERSYPEKIRVLATPRVFKKNRVENIELKTFLTKVIGSPSIGSEVFFDVRDSLNNTIGELVSVCNLKDQNKECTVLYNMWPDTTYVGKINVTASVLTDSSELKEIITLYTTN